tara:strand:+ start:611 stop:1567 length:957 start_codon:yes stop_codon:yes gene_type:complete
MYLPKSKYSVREASAGFFVYEFTKKPFEGGSYIQMSDGTFFAGESIHKISIHDKIIPSNEIKKSNTYEMDKSSTSAEFNFLTSTGKKYNKQQKKLEPIYPTKPSPTSEDYVKGYFYRYFAKRKNSATEYYEINEDIHKDLKSEGGKYDYNLYVTEKLRWDLTDSARKSNRTVIRKIKYKGSTNQYVSGKGGFQYLSSIFPNLEEYKLPDEVLRPKSYAENLNAPKPKLPIQKSHKVVEAQKGALDIIKEKSRKKYNKRDGQGTNYEANVTTNVEDYFSPNPFPDENEGNNLYPNTEGGTGTVGTTSGGGTSGGGGGGY